MVCAWKIFQWRINKYVLGFYFMISHFAISLQTPKFVLCFAFINKQNKFIKEYVQETLLRKSFLTNMAQHLNWTSAERSKSVWTSSRHSADTYVTFECTLNGKRTFCVSDVPCKKALSHTTMCQVHTFIRSWVNRVQQHELIRWETWEVQVLYQVFFCCKYGIRW